MEREISRYRWKVDAGAEYAVTQPVFDVGALDAFLDRLGENRIPVLAGIWPLVSYRNAEFMRNNTALGRYGKPDEIASVVTFLAGPGATYMTGATINVDGGWNA